MTWIYEDGKAPYWIEYAPPKPRKPARALKFGAVKVGDQLKQTRPSYSNGAPQTIYYLVTDRWFDPVAGQRDEVAGQMVGVVQIDMAGELRGRKSATTVRGLASQQYQYTQIDYIAQQKATYEALKSGAVVGIGKGRVIRARPKMPSATF